MFKLFCSVKGLNSLVCKRVSKRQTIQNNWVFLFNSLERSPGWIYFSFAITIPTTALVGYYGPNLTLTFSVNGTKVPSKNPWFSD